MFTLRIRSRNGSAAALRRQVQTAKRGVYRCGSFTTNNEIFTQEELRRGIIEINTVEASKISNNKTEMKKRFNLWHVPTAEWTTIENIIALIRYADFHEEDYEFPFSFPFIIKHNHSSQGNGIYLIQNEDELFEFLNDPNHRHNHIVEHYYTYVREYRLHVDKFGCFCANRKMLREDAEVRWHRHHSNSNWIREDNELFDRPTNWDEIVAAAQLARRACGLDICSVDVKVQSSRRQQPLFFILETNSGSALGEQTIPLYIQELTRLCEEKSEGINESFELFTEDQTSEVPSEENSEEYSEEELQNIQSVREQTVDQPAVFTHVDTTPSPRKKFKEACPADFAGCPHMIWTGEEYGHCDLTNKKCSIFTIDTSEFEARDDEDEEDYEDYDDSDDSGEEI